jgi:hypothetical protein
MKCAAYVVPLALLQAACGGVLDAGYDTPHGPLPVDDRSAMLVVNDGARDNWQLEYAAILAATTPLRLVGVVVNESYEYPSLDANLSGFNQAIAAARDSGLGDLPDPMGSHAPALRRPATGRIEDTSPNGSDGARLIVLAAKRWGTKAHPLTIATGGALTDVADAWLLDPGLGERAVVVASLGQSGGEGARTLDPNGDRDEWATFIVASRLRYVQVNAYYDQLADFPENRLKELPDNAFGAWIASKRPDILALTQACDQVSVLAAALPWFAKDVRHLQLDTQDTTVLEPAMDGPIWQIAAADTERARAQLWADLSSPETFR